MLSKVIKPIIPIKRIAPHKLIVIRDKRLQNKIIPRSIGIDTSYYVGKSIILFTLFYCSMNWFYYRNTRQDFENYEDNDNEDGKK